MMRHIHDQWHGLTMTPEHIMTALDEIAKRDDDLRAAVELVGYPPRNRPAGFETLMGIIIGQQVSTAAGNAIRTRLARNDIFHDRRRQEDLQIIPLLTL